MRNALWILVVSALVAGCASTPEGAAPAAEPAAGLNPVGSYTFSTTVQGMAVDGQLRITGSPGAWAGSMYSGVTGELPLSSIEVEGRQLRLTAETEDGTVYVRMNFQGDTFTGDWSLGAEGGSLQGRRVSR